MTDTKKSIENFVFIAFLLLAALFGMMIMTFIFGSLSEGAATTFTPLGSATVDSETGGFINSSTYILASSNNASFGGGVAITQIFNATSSTLIASGNFTLNPTFGTLVGTAARSENYTSVNITYTYNIKREAQVISDKVTNNSLTGISSYASQSSTQFITVAIAITLAVLIAIFIFFWQAFMGKGGFANRGGGGRSESKTSSGMDV